MPKNESKNFLQDRGLVALVTYKGYWIPATSGEMEVINLGQFKTEHSAVFDDVITRTHKFRYTIRTGGNSGYILDFETRRTREVLIAKDPAKFKASDFKLQDF